MTKTKFEKVLLIVNPKAGQGDLHTNLTKIVPPLAAAFPDLHILHTKKQGDATKYCQEFASKVDLIIVFGGDGTVFECTNGLAPLETRPTLAIIPGGTCNDFSRTLGVPQNIAEAAKLITKEHVKPVDVAKANGQHFLNFWGIGLVSEVSNNIDAEEKAKLGKIGYYLSTIRTVKNAETFPVKITYDGQVYEDEAVLVMVGNGEYLGGIPSFIPNVKCDDGTLDIFVVKSTGIQAFKDYIGKKLFEDSNDNDIFHVKAKSIHIETEEEKEVDTDGESSLHTPCHIELLPGHFTMIYNPAVV
ncbi:YegS/Rv2252/BmrU family lipid kinase [Bacillus tropicus]|uniref:diacylglycerol/lipid kinase family protein n=1 Tax=Bacillus TaxID=1386 RepID=UPI0008FDFDEB|nr:MULTISPECIES: YegS/Rv2252/BmrU family lipid kinase [Bacillus]MBH0350099.1 bis(5'-nucleosyl)-tetraphosphatase [Bacillus thuringiensis]MDA1908373.1 YegS/Rv2252/BmrU family lipid kinase [Bacillus cereus]MDA2167799.1 YegS/Rv2252/BmrU family lipid kinase [Bacillus cereus]MDF9555608.1 YegS/Rv2252/BmrU family lipid kinase [Bacillus tropicus]MDF9587227.1 YegS/Rv2252/BmrU family lipid kinase [Bacillus tropicus]